MVSLTIDGKNVTVPKETTILEAAAELGIKIPTLCWLQKVSPTGACRVCAVEIEGVDRPLDCPVCDAGGECDLQDSCYALDAVKQEYSALLERRPIRYDWRLLESDPNRCILCEKCVKV